MSRLVQAAKHIGCPKKKYKFEMHIHRVVLTSEKRKLFTRVLWTRGKKHALKQRFKTKWCEGVENYNIDESIFHEATIYFTSNTNQVQSKQTKITLQIRERIDGKDVKFAKFALDLAKYVDILSPHRVFYQRLNYEKARKKAQLIFTIKSMEIMSDGTVSDYTDDDDDDTQSQSGYSNYTDYDDDDDDDDESVLSEATLNTIQNSKTSKTSKTSKSYPSPLLNTRNKKKRNSAPNMNALAIRSNISGNKLKNRHFRNLSTSTTDKKEKDKKSERDRSPTPVIITRHDDKEKFVRSTTTKHDGIISLDMIELKRKLKIYEDKHKKYKYKYAKLSKKVEEQEIEQRCQQEQICRLKRVEEEIKEQYHTMAKYKKKIKLLTKEREGLKKTLQKRNQTIINLNKENSKLKQQVISLQTMESVQYNSDLDDNITTDDEIKNNINNTNSILASTKTVSPAMATKTYYKHCGYNPYSGHINNSVISHSSSNSNQMDVNSINSINSIISDDTKSKTSVDVDGDDEIKKLEIELNESKQNNQNWQNTIKELQTLADKQCINGKDEESTTSTTTPQTTVSTVNTMNQLIETLNVTNDSKPISIPISIPQSLMVKNDSILKEIQNQWMSAETDKLNYKKLYEKERARVNHYKSKTSSAYRQYEKSEIELSIARHQLEEIQQKHEVMEEVYMKLKQDLTRMMDRYSKLEYQYEKLQNKLRQNDQYLIHHQTNQ